MAGMNFKIEWETRLCEVDGELGYFHTWEQRSNVFGIVEFPDGVKRVDPARIKFCDEQNAMLYEMAKRMKGENDKNYYRRTD